MKQSLVQRQTQHLAPQQVLVAKMIQATGDELVQLITAETEKNLALEVTDVSDRQPSDNDTDEGFGMEGEEPVAGDETRSEDNVPDVPEGYSENDDYYDYSSSDPNRSADDSPYSPLVNYRSDVSFREELIEQLDELNLSDEDHFLASYIVDSLDDSGYLVRTLPDLVDDLAFTQMHETTAEELERVLVDVVQELEPAGIGARNLRECLLLQLADRKSTPAVLLAYDIVANAFDDLSQKRFERLCQRFKVDERQLSDAQKVISHLDPKPGGQSATADISSTRSAHIKADFSIHNEDGQLVVMLNDGNLPAVRISEDYQVMLERIQNSGARTEDSRQGLAMIREGISSANVFIEALEIRRQTLSRVIQAIANLQRNYFLNGGNSEDLRPMVLQDVADISGYDISTISRVSNSKYIDTDFGIISVKELFTTGIRKDDGSSISNVAVQDALRCLIEQEDKTLPLSDDALSQLLVEKGYPVARRTVAKYREQLGYPTARLRRSL